jgi:hypothetical protein
MKDLWDRVVPFPGTAPILAEHRRALPQVDQLCGPFWARLALLVDGRPPEQLPSQVQAAVAAGTLVYPGLDEEVRPAGEPAHRAGWEQLPHTTEPARAGSTARSLIAVIGELSAGHLEAVPVSGSWRADQLERLLSALTDVPAAIIANIATSALWGSHAGEESLNSFLSSGDDRSGPPPDWHVGHFAAIWGRVVGDRGTLLAVADTYGSLGTNGRYLQPLPRVARALHGRGLLVTGASGLWNTVRTAADHAGLGTALWD